jgi:hypothetical protein
MSTKSLKRKAVKAGLPLKHFARLDPCLAARTWLERKGLKPYPEIEKAPFIKPNFSTLKRRAAKRAVQQIAAAV